MYIHVPREMELEVRKGIFCAINFHFFDFLFLRIFTFLEFNLKSTTSVILWMYIIASFWYVSHTSFFLFPSERSLFFTYVSIIFWWCTLFLTSVRDVFDSFVSCLLFYLLVQDVEKFLYLSLHIFRIWRNEILYFSSFANKIVNFFCVLIFTKILYFSDEIFLSRATQDLSIQFFFIQNNLHIKMFFKER